MKKMTIFLACIGVFLLAFSIFAIAEKDDVNEYGKPFQLIWQAIENLQEQVNNLVERVDSIGSGGKRLMVVDANGEDVGYLIDYTTMLTNEDNIIMRVYDPKLNLFLHYSYNGQNEHDYNSQMDWDFYYTEEGCSGEKYASIGNPYTIFYGPDQLFYRSIGEVGYNVPTKSYQNGPDSSTCHPHENDPPYERVLSFAMKIEEFTPPTYVGPLHLVEK